MKSFAIVMFVSAVALTGASATFELSKIFQDKMVLQRGRALTVWGKGPVGETVTVSFGGQSAAGKVAEDEFWEATFASPFAADATGREFVAACSDGAKVTLTDVLVGDVWIAAGQSNMVMPLKGSGYGNTYGCDEAVAALQATSQIRLRGTGGDKLSAPEYYEVRGGAWAQPGAGNSAVAMHFALCCATNNPTVPVGIVQAAMNAMTIDLWMPREEGETSANQGLLWNSMLAPLKRFGFRGAIWYQGESNAADGDNAAAWSYDSTLAKMVARWRDYFGVTPAEFPFYLVQLAGYDDVEGSSEDPSGDSHPNHRVIRDSMFRATKSIENCGMAVAWDCGRHYDPALNPRSMCIHPKCKNVPGQRLALHALKDVYGKDVVAESPYWTSTRALGDGRIRVSFSMNGSVGLATGLKISTDAAYPVPTPGAAVKGFSVAGIDRIWHWAEAAVDPSGDSLTLSSATCPDPVYVRFAYRCNPIDGEANLYNREMLPVVPFTTDLFSDAARRTDDVRAFPGTFASGDVIAGNGSSATVFTNFNQQALSKSVTLKDGVFVSSLNSLNLNADALTLDNAEFVGNSTKQGTLYLCTAGRLRLVNSGSVGGFTVGQYRPGGLVLEVRDGVSSCGALGWTDWMGTGLATLVVSNAQLRVRGSVNIAVPNDVIDLTVPADGWASAPIQAGTSVALHKQTVFRIDASTVKNPVRLPLVTAGTTLTCDSAQCGELAEVRTNGRLVPSFAVEGKTLYLDLASRAPSSDGAKGTEDSPWALGGGLSGWTNEVGELVVSGLSEDGASVARVCETIAAVPSSAAPSASSVGVDASAGVFTMRVSVENAPVLDETWQKVDLTDDNVCVEDDRVRVSVPQDGPRGFYRFKTISK